MKGKGEVGAELMDKDPTVFVYESTTDPNLNHRLDNSSSNQTPFSA